MGYSQEERSLSIDGFVHCYRTASPNKNAFARQEDADVVRIVTDEVTTGQGVPIPKAILRALSKAKIDSARDTNGEHWEGPYGFAAGLWWRELNDRKRQAYVQGVFWGAESVSNVRIAGSGISVEQAVKRLNDWYLISDDDWKDARSNKRVDVPVLVALRQNGILLVDRAASPR
jgi:hypothetical protein